MDGTTGNGYTKTPPCFACLAVNSSPGMSISDDYSFSIFLFTAAGAWRIKCSDRGFLRSIFRRRFTSCSSSESRESLCPQTASLFCSSLSGRSSSKSLSSSFSYDDRSVEVIVISMKFIKAIVSWGGEEYQRVGDGASADWLL